MINGVAAWIQRFFFQEVSPKFRVDSLKNLMDSLYVLGEKIAAPFPFLHNLYLGFYEDLVDKEVKMASITSRDKVLVIGGGPIPATSMLITLKTHAYTTTLDVDSNAIVRASKVIEMHGLKDKMSCVEADGVGYPVDEYDVIFILYGVKQQREILRYVATHMKNEARVVYRTTEDVLRNIVGGEEYLLELFRIRGKVQSEDISQNISYLLSKV